MRTLEPTIAEHPFFRGLDAKHLELIASCAINVRFEAGEIVFREGEEANLFYLIRQGRLALETYAPGRGAVSIQTVGEGEVVGWAWLFPPHKWHFDACAVDPTRAIVFDGVCLRTKCEEDHDLGYDLIKRFAQIISGRLQATRLQLLDIYNPGG
jgi:CRP-like cAMP-binding protein